jgi:adenylate cyclase
MLACNGLSKEQPVAAEIEHKYLVHRNLWTPKDSGVLYRQGYLSSVKERVVRVRIAGDGAYLTVKGVTTGVTRLEFEYAIPMADAATILDQLCEHPLIEKTRYREEYKGHVWEIDDFHADNEGLLLAEIELAAESERYAIPPWAGAEVSSDPRYFNANLGLNPYKNWKPRDA